MQRLFSIFPASWPGLGLLILRLTLGTSVLVNGISAEQSGALPKPIVSVVGTLTGILLGVGLWTPFAAAIGLLVEMLLLLMRVSDEASHLHLAVLALSLIMLGPGAYSIDARLFGRKRIDLRHPH